MFLPTEIIRAKRDGEELSGAAIREFTRGVTENRVGDAQIGAFTMAVRLRGMSEAEQTALTLAMRDSGTVLEWPELNGPTLDKHSTGGVGDFVSLVLGPMLASCGAYVPMISGRGLGHTGGTLDKLESIPGYVGTPDTSVFRSCVRRHGVAIIGQSEDLAPADRRLYAVRDVTATIDSVPLIVASILSKKLAEGLDGLIIDVKTGNGAFMQEMSGALDLAGSITRVANQSGLPCEALVTDMSQPLAWSAGNALEVHEAIAYLSGAARHRRLNDVVMAAGVRLLLLGNLAESRQEADRRLSAALDSGEALERFANMVAELGGPADLCDRPGDYLASAPVVRPVLAGRDGYVGAIDTAAVGWCVVGLGGGRSKADDKIDPRVGLTQLQQTGVAVTRGEPLAVVHAASETDWETAAGALRHAIRIETAMHPPAPVIHKEINKESET